MVGQDGGTAAAACSSMQHQPHPSDGRRVRGQQTMTSDRGSDANPPSGPKRCRAIDRHVLALWVDVRRRHWRAVARAISYTAEARTQQRLSIVPGAAADTTILPMWLWCRLRHAIGHGVRLHCFASGLEGVPDWRRPWRGSTLAPEGAWCATPALTSHTVRGLVEL